MFFVSIEGFGRSVQALGLYVGLAVCAGVGRVNVGLDVGNGDSGAVGVEVGAGVGGASVGDTVGDDAGQVLAYFLM